MSVTRLTGGLSPADGGDPRTFPAIWNGTADLLDEALLPSGGSAGQVLVKDSGTDYDAGWGVRQLNFLTEPRTNLYFAQPMTAFRSDTTGVNLDRMIYAPTIVSRGVTVDRIAMNVATAEASALPRLGIYAANSENRPGALILDCGTVDASTTGVKEITINATIPAGLFFLAVAFQGASSALRVSHCNTDGNIIKTHHNLATQMTTNSPCAYQEDGISGALPATYGGVPQSATRAHPIVALRTATVL